MNLPESNAHFSSATNRLAFFVTITTVFLMSARVPIDSDLWWHLRAGEETYRQLSPLTHDLFSMTRNGVYWTNHSWLSQVILYLMYQGSGYLGVGLYTSLATTITMGLLYLQLKGPGVFRAFLIALACVVAAPTWSPRPQILTQLLLVVVIAITAQRHTRPKAIWWLVPIFALWGNLHGGFIIGFFWLGIVLVGDFLEFYFNQERQGRESLSCKRTLLVMAACWLAVLANPNGIHTWQIPFQTVSISALQQFIPEWSSPDFHDLAQQPFLICLGLLIFSFGVDRDRKTYTNLLAAAGFSVMALMARRNFGPFVIAVMPVLSISLWRSIEKTRDAFEKKEKIAGSGDSRDLAQPVWKKIINVFILFFLGFG